MTRAPDPLTKIIGAQVRRYRTERGWPAWILSRRCRAAGVLISDQALLSLERGDRGNVTVAEFLALAVALDIHPANLLPGYPAPPDARLAAARRLTTELSRILAGVTPDEAAEAEAADPRLTLAIEDLNLTTRSYNCLRREGIRTVADLVILTEEDVHDIRNVGDGALREIRQKLTDMGLAFATQAA